MCKVDNNITRMSNQFERYTDSDFRAMLNNLIPALQDSATREQALHLLSKALNENQNKVIREEMPPLLWHSFGTISILLQEVLSVYRLLCTPQLTERVAKKVCSTLALLQSVAAHHDTKMLFLQANIHMYLQPILNIKIKEKNHEYVRIGTLGVIGALVKEDNPEVIYLILKSQIFPCFLNCMEVGSILAKTVAGLILHKILRDTQGMKYCCALAERFYAIGHVLGKLIEELVESGSVAEDNTKRLLKHIIGCYHKLATNPRACNGLSRCLPPKLRDASFSRILHDDEQMTQCLQQLFENVDARRQARLQQSSQSIGNMVA